MLVLVFAGLAAAAGWFAYRSEINLAEANAQLRAAKSARSAHLAELARIANEQHFYERGARYALAGLAGADDPQTGFAAAASELQLRRAFMSSRRVSSYALKPGIAHGVAISPNGELGAISDAGGVRVIDIRSGAEITQLATGAAIAWDARFSSGGGTIFGALSDGRVRIWDAFTLAAISDLTGCGDTPDQKASLRIDPTGRFAVFVSKEICLWSIESGSLLKKWVAESALPQTAAFSPSGEKLAVGFDSGVSIISLPGLDGVALKESPYADELAFFQSGKALLTLSRLGSDQGVKAWDISTGQAIGRIGDPQTPIAAAAMIRGQDEDWVFLTEWSGTPSLWKLDGELLGQLSGSLPGALGAAVSSDSQSALAWSFSGIAQVWSLAGAGPMATLIGHNEGDLSAAISPRGESVLTASTDGTGRLWRVWPDRAPQPMHAAALDIYGGKLSGDAAMVVAVTINGGAELFDAATGDLLKHYALADGAAIISADVAPDGLSLVVGTDGAVRLLNIATGAEIGSYDTAQREAEVGFVGDGSRVLASYRQGGANMLEIRSGAVLPLALDFEGALVTRLSADGRLAAVLDVDGTVRVVDISEGRDIFRRTVPGAEDVSLSPDGRVLGLAAGKSGMLIVDIGGNTDPVRLDLPLENPTTAPAFSPDGTYGVAVSGNVPAFVFETGSGAVLFAFPGELLRHAEFSPDGRKLLVESYGQTAVYEVRRLGLPRAELVLRACGSMLDSRLSVLSDKELAAAPVINPDTDFAAPADVCASRGAEHD